MSLLFLLPVGQVDVGHFKNVPRVLSKRLVLAFVPPNQFIRIAPPQVFGMDKICAALIFAFVDGHQEKELE